MNNRTSFCLLIVCFSASAVLRAAEPPSRHLRGVTAGVTKQSELEKNDHWGKQSSKTVKPDGSTWIEYRFWAWKKVTAVVRAGVVQAIDAIPPDRLPAEKLAETLKLGQLTPVESRKSLGPRAFVGSSASEDWQVFRCSNAPGVLIFTEMSAGKQYAKLIRFYSLGPAQQITNSIGMKLKLIPAGEFVMGSPEGEVGERPKRERQHKDEKQHRVRITESFYIGVYEVTQEQYEKIMDKNPSHFKGKDRPVEHLEWNDALEFCQRLTQKEGKVYRLPTEAQWEYACRAGTTTPFAYGKTISPQTDAYLSVGNVRWREHKAVGSYRPNAWGLYDMHGNVSEWCADWYGENYYDTSPVADPRGPSSGRYRILRGGNFTCGPIHARSACRDWNNMYATNYGFRVVREVDCGKKAVSGALGKALLKGFGGGSAE